MTWWHWIIIGFSCLLIELALPFFVLIWFGLAAILLAGLSLLFLSMGAAFQLLMWVLLSLGMMGLWWRLFKKNHHKTHVGQSLAQLIGEEGLVTEFVTPVKNGKVRFQKPLLGAETWICSSEEELSIGRRVRVVSIEGSVVKVGKTGESTCPNP